MAATARTSVKNVTYRAAPRHIAAPPLVGGAACRPERKYPGPRWQDMQTSIASMHPPDVSGLVVETNAIAEEELAPMDFQK
jgi:hypothetical protein